MKDYGESLLMNVHLSGLYNGGSTLIRPVEVVREILRVLSLLFFKVKLPVVAVEFGLNKNLFPGGKAVMVMPCGSVWGTPSVIHPEVVWYSNM